MKTNQNKQQPNKNGRPNKNQSFDKIDEAVYRAAESKIFRSKHRKNIIPILAVLLILSFLFIELNARFFKIEGVPTWTEIFQAADLADGVEKVEGDLTVHFIDVGQGDCQLIRTSSKSVLIDCGEKEYYPSVIEYLKAQEITRLDYVIMTHPHSDHAGGMSYILEEFDIGTLIMPKMKDSIIPTTNTYLRILKAVESKNITIEYAEPGKEYKLDDAKMTVLSPVNDYSDLNNYSVSVKLIHGENSFMFTGDMEAKAEKDVLQSGADVSAKVLKVGHHGSDTSTSQEFLDAVDPQYAVIGVGSPNNYGHPNKETIEKLQSKNIEIYRTDQKGHIIFVSDGKGFNILTKESNNADN
ncbi:MAG: MBL fold metallo-hydrolase [Ruminococcaceae bacterium]|nr:MBL fold metallo-hydrolase [Oscillospiraceae bacterium]